MLCTLFFIDLGDCRTDIRVYKSTLLEQGFNSQLVLSKKAQKSAQRKYRKISHERNIADCDLLQLIQRRLNCSPKFEFKCFGQVNYHRRKVKSHWKLSVAILGCQQEISG